MIQLKDKGIKHLQANGKGSQHVHINVYVPTSLTSQEKKIIQDLSGGELRANARLNVHFTILI